MQQQLTIQQAADYLETAAIKHTIDHGYALTHVGTNAAGAWFVMVNDAEGQTTLIEQP